MNNLESVVEFVKFIRDMKTMILLGLLLAVYGLIQHFFHFDQVLGLGLTLLGVYVPLIAVEAIGKKIRSKRAVFGDAHHEEIMRKAQEAIDRAKRR